MSLSSGPSTAEPSVIRQWIQQFLTKMKIVLPARVIRVDDDTDAMLKLHVIDWAGASIAGEYLIIFWFTDGNDEVVWPASLGLIGEGAGLCAWNGKCAIGATSPDGGMNLYFNASGLSLKYKLHAAVVGRADTISFEVET